MAVPTGGMFGMFPTSRRQSTPIDPPNDRRFGTPPTAGGPRYQVERGDTLGEIAQAGGLSVQDLIARQRDETLRARLQQNPDLIHAGEELSVPEMFSRQGLRSVIGRRPPRTRDAGLGTEDEEADQSLIGAPPPAGGAGLPPPALPPGAQVPGGLRAMLEAGSFPDLSAPGVGAAPPSVEASLNMDRVAKDVADNFWPTMRGALGAGIAGGVGLGTGGLGLAGQMLGGAAGGAVGEAIAAPPGQEAEAAALGAVGGAVGPPVGRAIGAGLGAAGRALGLLPDPSLPPSGAVPMTPRPGFGPQGMPNPASSLPPRSQPPITVELGGQPGSPANPIPMPGSAPGSPAAAGGSPVPAPRGVPPAAELTGQMGAAPAPGLPPPPTAGALPSGPLRVGPDDIVGSRPVPVPPPVGPGPGGASDDLAQRVWLKDPQEAMSTPGVTTRVEDMASRPLEGASTAFRGVRVPPAGLDAFEVGGEVPLSPRPGGVAGFSRDPAVAEQFAQGVHSPPGAGVPVVMQMRPKVGTPIDPEGLGYLGTEGEILTGGRGVVRGIQPPTGPGAPFRVDLSQVGPRPTAVPDLPPIPVESPVPGVRPSIAEPEIGSGLPPPTVGARPSSVVEPEGYASMAELEAQELAYTPLDDATDRLAHALRVQGYDEDEVLRAALQRFPSDSPMEGSRVVPLQGPISPPGHPSIQPQPWTPPPPRDPGAGPRLGSVIRDIQQKRAALEAGSGGGGGGVSGLLEDLGFRQVKPPPRSGLLPPLQTPAEMYPMGPAPGAGPLDDIRGFQAAEDIGYPIGTSPGGGAGGFAGPVAGGVTPPSAGTPFDVTAPSARPPGFGFDDLAFANEATRIRPVPAGGVGPDTRVLGDAATVVRGGGPAVTVPPMAQPLTPPPRMTPEEMVALGLLPMGAAALGAPIGLAMRPPVASPVAPLRLSPMALTPVSATSTTAPGQRFYPGGFYE